VVAHASSTIPILEPVLVTAKPKQIEEEQSRPQKRMLGSRPPATLPNSTMIGELKLTALKARLTLIGIQAELIGEGVLICGGTLGKDTSDGNMNDTVAVRKTGAGQVELEGNVSDVYYLVRKEIYNLHALIAA
jgi:cleavage and polyadenylation specificity factor subunit 2